MVSPAAVTLVPAGEDMGNTKCPIASGGFVDSRFWERKR